MSLLMEALRKAEQQKRQQAELGTEIADQSISLSAEPTIGSDAHPEGFGIDRPAKLQLELEEPGKPARSPLPRPSAKSSGNQLPELPTRLEDLDDQFMVHAAKPTLKPRLTEAVPPPVADLATPHSSPPSGVETARDSARNVFAAKQAPRNDKRLFAIAVGVLTVAGSIGIGAWFWWQLQPKGGLIAGVGPTAAPVTPPPATAPVPATQVNAVPSAPTYTASAPTPAPASPVIVSRAPEEPAAAPVASRPNRDVATPIPQSPIHVGKATLKSDQLLEDAYLAFQHGEIEVARTAWQQKLAADPLNASALHGLAAIAQRTQRPDQAAEYFLRALEADPKDALALAGLVSMKMPADPQAMESRLKTLLVEQPDSPYLNFALGNLYARSARWADAQQAFFKAHVADPVHPDYLFNLAISLDQLHQNRLAIEYYQRSLAAAASQAAGFDVAQVTARLKLLQTGE